MAKIRRLFSGYLGCFIIGIVLGAASFPVAGIAQATAVGKATAADPALVPPQVNTAPLPYYDYDRLDFGMTIGIAETLKGRIWACWVAGGDNDDAFFVLATSDDRGKTWSRPRVVVDPHDAGLSQKRRSIVGNLWRDPRGRLWLFFDQSMTYFDGRAGEWYSICENPDSDHPQWSAPKRIWNGCSLNKPLVLGDGTWLLPVSLWDRSKITDEYKDRYHDLDSLRGANVLASTDEGKTWQWRGHVSFPRPDFDEHSFIELTDGTIWMTARTKKGIWESFSRDKGRSWTAPRPSSIQNINARHFIRRLQSGHILLVKNGMHIDQRPKTRSELTAYISEDDGKTWKGGLVLDERRGVSYPDGFQDAGGMIYISYDHNRSTEGEVLMARFREKDVLEGKFVTRRSGTKMLISRPLGLDKLPPPSQAVYRDRDGK